MEIKHNSEKPVCTYVAGVLVVSFSIGMAVQHIKSEDFSVKQKVLPNIVYVLPNTTDPHTHPDSPRNPNQSMRFVATAESSTLQGQGLFITIDDKGVKFIIP